METARVKEMNQFAMNAISEMKPCNNIADLVKGDSVDLEGCIKTSVLDRAIEAIYMQNKIIDTIATLEGKDCFTTDNKGVAAILSSLLIGSEESFVRRVQ